MSDDDDEKDPANEAAGEEFETEYRIDDQGRKVGIFKPKVRPDKNVSYFMFDREAREKADQIRYLNGLGAVGVLQAKMQHDLLKSGLSKAEYEYALWASENPWTVPGYLQQQQPKRSVNGVLLFALVIVAAAVAAALLYSTRPTLPASADARPERAPETANLEPPRKGRVER